MRDVPTGGPAQVVRDKRRWFCEEAACPRREPVRPAVTCALGRPTEDAARTAMSRAIP